MIYFESGSIYQEFSSDDLKNGLFEALEKMGKKHKVLAIPPDYTRLPSRAGELTEYAWQFYGEFVFRGDFNSKSNQTITNSQNETINLINLAFGMKVFKNKRGEISLGINDLLNQNENIQQIVSDSYIEDARSNSVKRFLLLSFTYNIKNYNSGKKPSTQFAPDRERERMGRWEERRF